MYYTSKNTIIFNYFVNILFFAKITPFLSVVNKVYNALETYKSGIKTEHNNV